MVNILLAPDKFKGSLTAKQVCETVTQALLSIRSDINVVQVPMADGGDGTGELLTTYSKGTLRIVRVSDPLFRPIDAVYGISGDKTTAFIEMAKASGLVLLQPAERNPLRTTTLGTGELIRDALAQGVQKIIIGIGGSATNDGGMGAVEALGVKFFSAAGERLSPIGENLGQVHTIDTTHLDSRLANTALTILCDVDNPLYGPQGAAPVFGRQKGATDAMIDTLDKGLHHYGNFLEREFNTTVNFPGAGAAGGFAASLHAMTTVAIRKGTEFMMEFTNLEEKIRQADVIITGEGKIDTQTLSGKVVKGVSALAALHHKKVYALAGKNELDAAVIRKLGLVDVISLVTNDVTETEATSRAQELLSQRIREYFAKGF